MEDRHEILTLVDIKLLVDTFYGKVREDDLLGPVFAGMLMADKVIRPK